jgi:MFS family permease
MADSPHAGRRPPAGDDRRIRAWRDSVYLIFALCGVGLAGVVTRIPAIRDDLAVTMAEMGLLLLGLSLGSVIGLVASGQLVSILGARRAIVGSLAAAAVGLVTVGLASSAAHSFGLALAGLLLFGFGCGVCNVAMNVEGAAVERFLLRPTMPLFHASFSVGSVVGSGIGAAASLLGVGVLADLGLVAVLLCAGAACAAPFLQSSRTTAEAGRPRERHVRAQLAAWLEKRTVLIGLLVLTTSFAGGSGNDWLALAMVDGHGTENSVGALTYGAFVVAGTVGRLAGVNLLRRFGRVPVLRGSAAVSAVGLILVIFVPNASVAFAGALLWGLGTALGFPVGMSAAADDAEHASARISVVATIGYGASLVGPPFIGFIGEYAGILDALVVVLVFVLGSALVAGSAREQRPDRTGAA